MDFHLFLLVIFVPYMKNVHCNDFFMLSNALVDLENILYSVNTTTITSCHLKCSQESNCRNVVLTQESNIKHLFKCFLLKNEVKSTRKNGIKVMKLENLEEESKGNKEEEIKQRNFPIITKFSKQFILNVEIKLSNFDKKNARVVQLTIPNTKYHTPTILFNPEGDHLLMVRSAINGSIGYRFKYENTLPLNKWFTVVVSQMKNGDEYKFNIIVDGQNTHSVVNSQAKELKNVQVYLGGVQSKQFQSGYVRNFWVQVED